MRIARNLIHQTRLVKIEILEVFNEDDTEAISSTYLEDTVETVKEISESLDYVIDYDIHPSKLTFEEKERVYFDYRNLSQKKIYTVEYETVVIWPDAQDLMEKKWFKECELINDDLGLKLFGSSAYIVSIERLNEQ